MPAPTPVTSTTFNPINIQAWPQNTITQHRNKLQTYGQHDSYAHYTRYVGSHTTMPCQQFGPCLWQQTKTAMHLTITPAILNLALQMAFASYNADSTNNGI
eukprot:662746-Ditylum_brightwellii.AAC.1